jgi:hypothetical protein
VVPGASSNRSVSKACAYAERLGLSKIDYGWLGQAEQDVSTAVLTRREISIVSCMVNLHKNRTALKAKVETEKDKAEQENSYASISSCLRQLMARAESGRDLGAIE